MKSLLFFKLKPETVSSIEPSGGVEQHKLYSKNTVEVLTTTLKFSREDDLHIRPTKEERGDGQNVSQSTA